MGLARCQGADRARREGTADVELSRRRPESCFVPEAARAGRGGAMYDYDLLVIGSGPSGRRAAIQAAKLGRSVLVVERGPSRRRRLGPHRHDSLEDPARDGAQPVGLARTRLLRTRLSGQAGHRSRRLDDAHDEDARPRGRGARTSVPPQRGTHHAGPRSFHGSASRGHRRRQRRDARRDGRQRAHRVRHAAVPAFPRALRRRQRPSTATRFSTSRSCRAA